jgi:hypothetical protein
MGDGELPRWLIFTLVIGSAVSFALGSYLEIGRPELLFAHPYWSNLLSSVTGFCTSASIVTVVIRRAQIRQHLNRKLAQIRPLAQELAGEVLKTLVDLMRATGVPESALDALPTGPSTRLYQRLVVRRGRGMRDSFLAVLSVHWVTDYLLEPLHAIRTLLESHFSRGQAAGRKQGSGRRPADVFKYSASDYAALQRSFNHEHLVARAVTDARRWEGSEVNDMAHWNLRTGAYNPIVKVKPDFSVADSVMVPSSGIDSLRAYTRGIHISPWLASDQSLQPVRRRLRDLNARIHEMDFGPIDATPLLRALGTCERLWDRWAELGRSEEDWRKPVLDLRKAADTGKIYGPASAPLAAIEQYERDCRLPVDLAIALIALWATLLDLESGEALAPLTRARLIPSRRKISNN